jgi:hypothetical protein
MKDFHLVTTIWRFLEPLLFGQIISVGAVMWRTVRL